MGLEDTVEHDIRDSFYKELDKHKHPLPKLSFKELFSLKQFSTIELFIFLVLCVGVIEGYSLLVLPLLLGYVLVFGRILYHTKKFTMKDLDTNSMADDFSAFYLLFKFNQFANPNYVLYRTFQALIVVALSLVFAPNVSYVILFLIGVYLGYPYTIFKFTGDLVRDRIVSKYEIQYKEALE